MRLVFNFLLTIWSCVSIQLLQAPVHLGIDSKPFWIEHISRSIERHEGGLTKDTLPWRLNNPGGLIWVGQLYAHRDKSGFASFDSRQYGKMAVREIVERRFEWGLPLREIIKPWGNKENRGAYVKAIKLETGWIDNY